MKDLNAVEFEEQLNVLGACNSVYQWAKGKTLYQAWKQCKHADWMIWYLAKIKINRKLLVELACDIAETVLCLMPKKEKRPRIAIDITRKWLRGEATIEEVDKAVHNNTVTRNYSVAAKHAIYAAYATLYATHHNICSSCINAVIHTVYATEDKSYEKHDKLICDMIRQKVDIKTL